MPIVFRYCVEAHTSLNGSDIVKFYFGAVAVVMIVSYIVLLLKMDLSMGKQPDIPAGCQQAVSAE